MCVFSGNEVLGQLQLSSIPPHMMNGGRGGEEEPIPTLDALEAQKQVKRVIQYLEQRVDTLRENLDLQDKTLNLAFQFKEWRRDVKTVSVL